MQGRQQSNREAKRMTGKRKQFRASIKAAVLAKLSDDKVLYGLVDALIAEACRGNVQAATWIRDTAGQKPTDKAENTISGGIEVRWMS